jgi:hypothetical protein
MGGAAGRDLRERRLGQDDDGPPPRPAGAEPRRRRVHAGPKREYTAVGSYGGNCCGYAMTNKVDDVSLLIQSIEPKLQGGSPTPDS